jgi:hypothetical protein
MKTDGEMKVQRKEILTLPLEAVVDQVQVPATLPPGIQPPYQLILIKYAILISEKLRHQDGIHIRPTNVHLSYCTSNGPKAVRLEVNVVLFKGAGNDGRIVSPTLANKYTKLAALILKIKANLSQVPMLDNVAPFLNCGIGAPLGGITDPPASPWVGIS